MLYECLAMAKATVRELKRSSKEPAGFEAAREIYAPHGSFMIFSREYWREAAGLNHNPFLFGEEITVAEYSRGKNLPVIFDPSLSVHHIGHASMGTFPSRRKLNWLREATRFCADEYF
jgi:hypothetical protein